MTQGGGAYRPSTTSIPARMSAASRWTLPGARDHRRLLVRGTQTTVARRLLMNASHWTTTTGRRNPGSDRRLAQFDDYVTRLKETP